MYYKIISDGLIVDACSELNYVRWQERNRLFLSCEQAGADGFVSSDGSQIYLLENTADIEDLPHATFTEITLEEYTEIRNELIDGGAIDTDTTDPEEEARQEFNRSEILKRMEELEAQNMILIECIMEMSEVVYGGE